MMFRCSHHAFVGPPAGHDQYRTASRRLDIGEDAHNSQSVGRRRGAGDGTSIGPAPMTTMVVLTSHCGPPFFAESGDSSRLTTMVILTGP